MPLGVLNVKQVDTASGFGIYSERANHIYKPGEKIVLYMEPVGYGYGKDGLGNSMIALSVDITVVSAAGEKLGTMEKRPCSDRLSLAQSRTVLQTRPLPRRPAGRQIPVRLRHA
ncbi:hypothetical protein [Mesorhizobium australicum]|uniref:hypothetical protein n=1 Tax=Mesorhizobium australicum TaxID=536018 RepID=UPI0033382543